MKTLKISQKDLEASNDCGGFKDPVKGKHLDTQMFPECEGKETDRNIVKKTEEKRKKEKHKKSENTQNELKVVASDGKYSVKLSKQEYLAIGNKMGWIKEANLTDALSDLNNMIDKGIEFPIAIWEVTKKYKLSENEVQDLKNDYDNKDAEDARNMGYTEAKKKKKWNPNPWAVCTKSVGREDKEKYERCVMDVKKNQKKD